MAECHYTDAMPPVRQPDDDAFLGVEEARLAAEAVVWLGSAALSGVLGNSADRWLRRAVSRRYRWRLVRLPDLTATGAVELALLALEADGLAERHAVTESYATKDPTGRWVVTLHLGPELVYVVRIPRRGHRPDAVRVHVARPPDRPSER